MLVNKSYKSQIKISQQQKENIGCGIFLLNQLYNFMIDFCQKEENQRLLVENDFGKIIDMESKDGKTYQKFTIIKPQKACTYIDKKWKLYAENRKLSLKGFSKPIQIKMIQFLKNFNKINMSSQKDFNFKISSADNYGSITTDSSIKLFKNRYKAKSGKKKTKYYVKIGREIYQFKNRDLNIKNFTPKTANISRKNGKYYISLSGYQKISKKVIDSSKNLGIDVNFETIVGSDGFKVQLKNLQNKLNLYTKKLEGLKQKQSKRVELAKEVLKTICEADKIDMYNGKRFTTEAKQLYRSILSQDKKYCRLKKQINKKYEKRTNVQDDLYKKIASKITTDYDLCFIEDLNVQAMVNSKVKNINLYNVSLTKLLTTIKNKAHTTRKIIIEVEPAYTSKTCNNCKEINNDLGMQREWICPSCESKLDRDFNAARNIQELGMMQFQSGTRL